MAGTIITDFIRADANKLSLNVGNTIIASVNALGILSNTGNVLINSSGVLEANSVYYNGSPVLSSGKVQRVNQPVGSVLQVVNTTYTSTFSQAISARSKLNNVQVSITPTSSTSKMLVMYSIFFEGNSPDHNWPWFLYRDSTDISAPAAGSRGLSISMPGAAYYADDKDSTPITINVQYLDSPNTTNTITYSPGVYCAAGSATLYVNRSVTDSDTIGYERGISSITVMEIAA